MIVGEVELDRSGWEKVLHNCTLDRLLHGFGSGVRRGRIEMLSPS
jgi:hypothetical protein